MKVIRENSTEYYPFYKLLEGLSNNCSEDEEGNNSLLSALQGNNEKNYFEKYNYIFNILTSFEKETVALCDVQKIFHVFKNTLKKILPIKECSLLFFDQNFSTLAPFDKKPQSLTNTSINSYYKEGILNNVFEQKLPAVLPLLSSYESNGPKLNFLAIPIFEDNKRRGLLAILTTLQEKNISDFDKKLAEILLLLVTSKIDKLMLKGKISSVYDDLKIYQAKLSNDYRLAAVGEMTKGIVEDILSPLQVIVSQVDLITAENQNNYEVDLLKAQIKKINETVNRLVKYVDSNPEVLKIHPCNLNDAVADFYEIFKSTLENVKIVCELDLQQDLPPILSHPNYLSQILTHLFGMIKNRNKSEGAVIVQTRFVFEEIILKIISSIDLSTTNASVEEIKTGELNIKIIDNLMAKHEGKFSILSTDIGSSIMTLTFPLRRKIRV